MSENMPKPSAFSLIYRADDTAILLDSIQNFRVADFCCPADLLHLLKLGDAKILRFLALQSVYHGCIFNSGSILVTCAEPPENRLLPQLPQSEDLIPTTSGGTVRQSEDGTLCQSEGLIPTTSGSKVRQSEDLITTTSGGTVRQSEDCTLRQSEGLIPTTSGGTVRQSEDGTLCQSEGLIPTTSGSKVRQSEDPIPTTSGGTVRQSEDGTVRQSEDGTVRQSEDPIPTMSGGTVRQSEDGILRQSEGLIPTANGGTVRQSEDLLSVASSSGVSLASQQSGLMKTVWNVDRLMHNASIHHCVMFLLRLASLLLIIS